MKKLSLLSRRLLADKTCRLSLCFLFILAFHFSCRTSSTTVAVSDLSVPGPAAELAVSPYSPQWLAVHSRAGSQVPLRFSSDSCDDQELKWQVPVKILGLIYDVNFTMSEGVLTSADVEGTTSTLSNIDVDQRARDYVCGSHESLSKSQFAANLMVMPEELIHDLLGATEKAVKALLPECQNQNITNASLNCQLPGESAEIVLKQVDHFRRIMTKRWSRQPYILARRAGVISTLAKTQLSEHPDQLFAKYCKMLEFSLVEELPVVMNSKRWQKAVCGESEEIRREAVSFALLKGMRELQLLQELYEETSREGTLSVSIPLNSIPGFVQEVHKQPIQVVISPNQDVVHRLVEEAKTYLERDRSTDFTRKITQKRLTSKRVAQAQKEQAQKFEREPCWDPIFSDHQDLLQIANGMKLIGENFKLACSHEVGSSKMGESTESLSLSRYLSQSLSSETEFVLDNGQTKLLRLPKGHYQYTVRVLPPNPLDDVEGEDEEQAPKSHGEIGWGDGRNHSIRSWNE